jgi:hypothetical protein
VGVCPNSFILVEKDNSAMRMQESSPAKLFVRRAGSNKFLKATGRWTKKAEAAVNFPNLFNAVHTCLAKGLKDVELVLRLDGDPHDHCYPLDRV